MTLRRVPRAVLVAVVAVVALLAVPVRAFAHTELERTTPGDGQTVASAPASVQLFFGGSVQIESGGIRVVDAERHRVDRGDAHHVLGQGSQVEVSLRPNLANGTYLVTWRAISEDSHPVSGAFTFNIGAPGATPQPAETAASAAVGFLLGTARFVDFVALALLLGGLVFVAVCWPAGAKTGSVRRLLAVGWWSAFAATAAGVFLQGPYGAGVGLGAVFHSDLLHETLHGRFGAASLYRLVALLLLGMVLTEAGRRVRASGALDRWLAAVVAVLGIGILATVAVAGHAGDKPDAPLAVTMDVVHLAAMAAWIGGLAALLVCVLPAPDGGSSLRAALPRFSKLAAGAVVVLIGSGVYASWRELGAWGALWGTRQGQILLVKLGILCVLLVVAAVSRRWLLRRVRSAGSPGWSDVTRLRLSLGAETVLATGVLAVTAVLVAAAPGRTEWRPSSSFTLAAGPVKVQLSVVPRGPDLLDVRAAALGADGRVEPVPELSATAALPSRGISGLPIRFVAAGPGRFVADALMLPSSGTWMLDLHVRTSAIDEYDATAKITVR